MKPETILKRAQDDGVAMTLCPPASIKLSGPEEALETWQPIARANKQQLIALLRKRAIGADEIGRQRLQTLASEYFHPLSDLLDWYADDLIELGTLPESKTRRIVADYIENAYIYRRVIFGQPHNTPSKPEEDA